MSISRVYQARVTGLEVKRESGEYHQEQHFESESSALFQHHSMFQDAVNYYTLSIVALASRKGVGALQKLRMRIEQDAWEPFYRGNQCFQGVRGALSSYLDLEPDAKLKDAEKVILSGNQSDPAVLDLVAESLMLDLGGDGAIQQGGRTYLPLLCSADSSANFPRAKVNRKKVEGKAILASLLHYRTNLDDVQSTVDRLDYAYFANPTTDGKMLLGAELQGKLLSFLEAEHAIEQLDKGLYRELEQAIEHLKEGVSMPNYAGGSINKEALKRRFYLFVLLTYVSPHPELLIRLRDTFKKPTKEVTEFTPKKEEQVFYKIDDDPIKIARGERGYVFSAFTALQSLGADGAKMAWKEYDIAAFKEALKTINQFKSKTAERESRKEQLGSIIAYIKGESSKKPKVDDEETSFYTFKNDVRYGRIQSIVSDLSLDDEEGALGYGVTGAGLRGFNDIQKTWNAYLDTSTASEDSQFKKLIEVVDVYQQQNSRKVGDVSLFKVLAKVENHVIWRSVADEVKVDRAQGMQPVSALSLYIDLLEYEDELERCSEPIRYTPADAIHSRRLFMFSDMSGKTKPILDSGDSSLQLSLGLRDGGVFIVKKAKLKYSAPRLKRDDLITLQKGCAWSSPLLKALDGAHAEFDKIAISYMPTVKRDGGIKHLLNFPVTLNVEQLQSQLGIVKKWDGNFNGAKNEKIHLLWPSISEALGRGVSWWKNPDVIRDGVQCLSVDLGLRSAAYMSLLEMRCDDDFYMNRVPFAKVGEIGAHIWRVALPQQVSAKLQGEGRKVRDAGGKLRKEYGGRKGRPSTEGEWEEAIEMVNALGITRDSKQWLGGTATDYSYPEQNDKLIKILRRSCSKMRRYIRYGWDMQFTWDGDEELNRAEARSKFLDLRDEVEHILAQLVNRVLPQRDYEWQWQDHSVGQMWKEMVRVESFRKQVNAQGQRGVSIARIEQLDSVRRLLMSYNRIQRVKFGEKPLSGKERRGEQAPEVCQEILTKLDHMKEQRVNQTANMILAQALGVRQREHQVDRRQRVEYDIHAEYEPIPGRRVVDFIVMEDLRRYQTKLNRAPYENSRLMQWCHRAIVDKLKLLCEVYGITVLTVNPAYSSKFHITHHYAGFRAKRYTVADAQSSYAQYLRSKPKLTVSESHKLGVFDSLLEGEKKGLSCLWYPEDGGEFFFGVFRDGGKLRLTSPISADLNASVNIGLAALAAPNSLALLRKVRAEHKKGQPKLVRSNKREKAGFQSRDKITYQKEQASAYLSQPRVNYFLDSGDLLPKDRVVIDGVDESLTTAKGIFGILKSVKVGLCMEFNNELLQKAGVSKELDVSPVEDEADDGDDIMM